MGKTREPHYRRPGYRNISISTEWIEESIMSTTASLRKAGLLIFTDAVSIAHRRYGPQAQIRLRRFIQLRRMVAKLKHGAKAAYAARLVTLDMVLPSQLVTVCKSEVYRHLGQPNLEWIVEESGRIDRRILSPLTALSYTAPATDVDHVTQLTDWLGGTDEYASIKPAMLMGELEQDMYCWALRRLSGPIGAHVTGMKPMWAVSRLTLARAEFKRVLRTAISEFNEERELEIASFEDAAFGANAKQEDDALLKMALAIIAIDGNKTEQENFHFWLASLLKLKDQIQATDSITSIIICWMMDLIESGTVGAPDARIGTRVRYIKQTALRLWRAFKATNKRLENLSENEIRAIYLGTLEDKSCTDLNGLGSGISSFQNYAAEVWDFPEVQLDISKHIPESKPRAQLVYPHEVALGRKWLADFKDGDSYLIEICHLLLDMFDCVPARLQELLLARLNNLTFSEDGKSVEIELYPAKGKKFKNLGSIRRETISDISIISKLRKWVERRLDDGAEEDAFIFGIDAQPGIYRRALVVATLRIVLKAVTGDDTMTIHAMRHTVASRNYVEYQYLGVIDQNRNFENAEALGHLAPPMGFHAYIHSFEEILASEMKFLNYEDIDFVDIDAPDLVGRSRVAIRAEASRSSGRESISTVIWQALFKVAESIYFAPIGKVDQWVQPAPPKLKIVSKQALTPLRVLSVIKKLQTTTIVEASVLMDIPALDIQEISDCVFNHAHQKLKALPIGKRALAPPIITIQDALSVLNIDVRAGYQSKYATVHHALASDMTAQMLQKITGIWPDCIKGNYVRLDVGDVAVPLLEFLNHCGVQADQLLVLVQPCVSTVERAERLARLTSEYFSSIWNSTPVYLIDEIDHDSRPDAYLQWPTEVGKYGPTSVSVMGLITLIYCAVVFNQLSKVQENDNP